MANSISVVLPVLNEERFIRKCLLSVEAFVLPAGWSISEILVYDGGSVDNTAESVLEAGSRIPKILLLRNPGKIQSTALNLAIKKASGDYILRLDAHAVYPIDYLENCINASLKSRADNVGGLFVTMPGNSSYGAQLVQALTTHRFGVGNSGFRLGEGPGKADTVPYGFFRKELFFKAGFFDERLVRGQDYEMNRRIAAAGGVVWREPSIVIQYFNQPYFLKFLKKQLFLEAPYNAYMWFLAPYAFAWRHAVTGLFAFGVLVGMVFLNVPIVSFPYSAVLGLYACLSIIASSQQALKFHDVRHLLALPFCFFAYHFIHGIGVLFGLICLLLGIAPVQGNREPWAGAGQYRAWPPPNGKSWDIFLRDGRE